MIIVGSVREGRKGPAIAEWVRARLAVEPGVELDVADLKEVALPLMDEPNHPRMRQYTRPHTVAWSQRVDAADAFVLVTPEYNHSYIAPVKNAFDYLSAEWRRKPIGFIGYGGVSAGTRGIAALQEVVNALGMVPATTQVTIPMFAQFLADDGGFEPNEQLVAALDQQLAELVALDGALRPLR